MFKGVVGMKLKAFKKTIKRIGIGGCVLVGGTYILSSMAYGFTSINNTIERDYYEIKYHTDDLFDAVSNEDLERIDYDALGKITSIRIDMIDAKYFSNLKYFTNLEKIEICNSQLLTDENIEQLNYLPLKEINLYFDRNYVLKNIDKKFDLNRFANKKSIKNITFNNSTNSDEIEGIIFYEYLENYDHLAVDFIKYEPLNDALDKVIDDLELTDCEDETEQVYKVAEYMVDHMHYDEEILDYTKQHKTITVFQYNLYKKLQKYNEKTLSRVVSNNPDSDKSCVCVNYSDLGLALLIKSGIKGNSVDGEYNSAAHAWNYANIDGHECYIDFTRLDTSDNLKDTLHRYNEYGRKADYDLLNENVIIDFYNLESDKYSPNRDFYDYLAYNQTIKSDINNIYGTRDNQVKIFVFNALWSLLLYEGTCASLTLIRYIKEKIRIRANKPKKEKKAKIKRIKKEDEQLKVKIR